MFLARKFTRAKWKHKPDLFHGEISADAVTSDLRTKDDALSFWKCGGATKPEIEEAALALAAAGNRIDKIDLVWLTEEELREDGQTLECTPDKARTPVSDLARLHVDVSRLDYVRLGKVAEQIVSAIASGHRCRFRKQQVKSLIIAAVEEGRIDTCDLQGSIRTDVKKALGQA